MLAPQTNEKRFLILGQTGSGKSTFINMLDNYFRKVLKYDPSNVKLVIPNNNFYSMVSNTIKHNERANTNPQESQTDGVALYPYEHQLGDLVFMDTPGFGDTRGIVQDEANIAKIIQEASNADYINAIVLIVNGTVARFTSEVIYIFRSLKSFFPNQMSNNIILVLTNTGRAGLNFDYSGLEKEGIPIAKKRVFVMNNMAFSKDPKTYDEEMLEDVQMAWKRAMTTMDELLDCAARLPPIRSTVFKEIMEKRTDIKLKILDIQNKLKTKQVVKAKLKALQDSQPDIAANIAKYQDYKQTTEVDEIVQQPTSCHNTVCLSCQSNCHSGCGLNEISSDGSNEFAGCAAFHRGSRCNCEHDHSTHAHRRFLFSKEKKSVEQIVHHKKALHDQYVNLQQQNTQKEQGLAADLSDLQSSIDTDQAAIHKAAEELRGLCSGFNLAKDLEINITNLERDQVSLFDPDTRAENQSLINGLKDLCRGFSVHK